MHFNRFVVPVFMLCFVCGVARAHPIHEAARTGNAQAIERLLSQGIDVNQRDDQGDSALHHAVAEAQIEVVNVLLKRANIDVNIRNNKGETPLHLAGSRGRPKTVALLIEKGAELNAVDNDGKTALCRAASEGRPETIQALLDKGADLEGIPGYEDNFIAVPLLCAVDGGKLPIVTLLLEKGAPLNGLALLPAIARNDPDQVKFLLGKGLPISGQAMAAAIAGGNRDLVTLLLDKGGLTDYQALAGYMAQQQGSASQDMLKFVLEKERGARTRATPLLLLAVMNGNLEQLSAFIDLGINVNGRDEYGNTPLHRAAEYGVTDGVRLLLAKGAQINAKTERGNTPLHKAVVAGNADIVKQLVAAGANVNATNEINITPLHMAAARNQAEFVGLFLRKGADIKLRSDNGHTAAEVARNNGYEDLARVLGIQPNAASPAPPESAEPPLSRGAYSEPDVKEMASASGITIKAPVQAENGAIVPVVVDINPELRAGDRLTLQVNNGEVACTVQPRGNVVLTGFSTRVRMSSDGPLRVVVTRSNGAQTETAQPVRVTVGASIPRLGKADTSYKTKTRPHEGSPRSEEFLILVDNAMAWDSYIKNILVTLADGAVEISATPWLSSNPLIGFKTPNSLAKEAIVNIAVYRP